MEASRRKTWTTDEDRRLSSLVDKYGCKRWALIASHLEGRVGKQCRERWHNHLRSSLKKGYWSEEEDKIIIQGVHHFGTRWAKISEQRLPHRTDNDIKNRYNSLKRHAMQCREPTPRQLKKNPLVSINLSQPNTAAGNFPVPIVQEIPTFLLTDTLKAQQKMAPNHPNFSAIHHASPVPLIQPTAMVPAHAQLVPVGAPPPMLVQGQPLSQPLAMQMSAPEFLTHSCSCTSALSMPAAIPIQISAPLLTPVPRNVPSVPVITSLPAMDKPACSQVLPLMPPHTSLPLNINTSLPLNTHTSLPLNMDTKTEVKSEPQQAAPRYAPAAPPDEDTYNQYEGVDVEELLSFFE